MGSKRSLGLLLIAASLALLIPLATVVIAAASDGDANANANLSTPLGRPELKYPNLGSRLDQLVTRVELGDASATEAAEDTSVHQRLGQPPPLGTAPGGSFTTDQEALVALYNATDGDNWAKNDNWLTDAPLGNWYGVTTAVTPEGNVQLIGLDLAENRLAGELPPELSNLAHLEALSLRDNQLTGEIPVQLGNLYYLSSLHLAGNQLTGCLPANWEDVPSNDFGDAGLPFCEASSPESLPTENEKRSAAAANSSSRASTMYWADQGTDKIQRANLDGSRVEDVVTSLPQWVRSSRSSGPSDIALDVAAGKVYWTVWDGNPEARNKIQRANLDGSRVEDLVTALPGVRKPNGLALDLSAGKIYWTNTFDDDEQGTDKIQRANLDGSRIEDLVTSGLGWPIGISLDAAAGKMYWTDTHANKIQRANLDGSQVEDLIASGLDVSANMALDVAAGKMYWTNYQWTGTALVPGSGEILRANLDGSQAEDLVTSGLDRPDGLALDVAAGKMYWADRDKSKIQRANLDGSQVEDLITSGLDRPSDIALDIPDTVAPPPPAGACYQTLGALTATVTRNGAWTGACASTHRDGRYARFYSFSLNRRTEVQITLTSSQDTFLYLLRGADANGAVVTDNDDIESGNTNSRITETLAAGTYTVEATTYNEGVTGSFILEVGPHSSPGPVSQDAVFFSAGILNGQRLNAVTPSLSVTPGQSISGTVHIAVQNDHRPGAIFPVGATPTWGDHQSSYWSIDHSAPSFSTTPYEVPVDLTAPSTPGVYAIAFAAAPETSLAHVMSATRWYSGPPRWDNGDDIAGWDASQVNFAMANGYVIVPSYPEESYHFGATAVRIVVNPTNGPPPSTDSCFQSLGALTAAVTRNASWTGDCASTHRSDRYARYYTFTLSQQTEVQIDLTSSQDTFLYLLRRADANGAVVTDNDDVESGNTNSHITRTLAADTYTIEATTYGEGVTGDFTLSIVPAGATAPPPATDGCFHTLGALTAAVTRNASWTGDCASTHRSGSYARFYTFTLSQQTEVQIDLTSSQDTFLYLLRGADANGTVVTDNDDVESGNTNSHITRTLAADTYTIEATTYGEGVTGDFTLSIVPAGATAPPPATDGCFQSLGALTAAVTRDASWTGDCASTHRSGSYARFYSFTLSQQTEVQINLTSSQDTFLYLLRGADANGTVVTDNDDVESGNTNSRITETLAAGTYTIEATTYGEGVTGDFTLSIVPAGTTAPPQPPPADACEYILTAGDAAAPSGGSISGQWTGDCASTNQSGSHARYYTFTLPTASEVTITLESSVDTFLYLLEGAGTVGAVVAENDDVESGNTNSQITEFLAAGTYTIEATTYKEAVTGEFALTVTSVTVTPVPGSEDREALVVLYHATGGANWYSNDNWLSAAPVGQWYGVTTDSVGRVIGVSLSFNNLSGEIPVELASLSNLEVLLLRGNLLSGEIPTELSSLSNLEVLDLADNLLNGEIPTQLGNLTSLVSLHLARNQLTGCIPEGLADVASNDFASLGLPFCASGNVSADREALVALYHATGGAHWTNNHNWLSNAPLEQWYGVTTDSRGRVGELELVENGLSGRIPTVLGDLSSLRRLRLHQNQLSGNIPSELGRLSNLEVLSLWANELSGEIPLELVNLSNLEVLSLAGNQLTGQIPVQLANLSNLELLGLGSNQFYGELPPELGRLSNLEWLDLASNRLRGRIPTQLGNLSNLQRLWLGYNQWSGDLPTQLGNLTKLRGLSLPGNTFGGPIPFWMSRLTKLEWLYLSSNRFTGAIPSWLGSLTKLGGLTLSHNELSGEIPPELANLNLRYLRLAGNQLTGCIPEGLRNVERNDFDAVGLPFCGDGSPDLIAELGVSDGTLEPEASLTLYGRVENQGDGLSASTTLRYYRSTNATISTSDAEVAREPVVSLGPSGRWFPPAIPLTAPSNPGIYYYGACVDPVPGESNPDNNCSTGKMVTVIDPAPANQAPTVFRVSPSSAAVSLNAGDSQTFSARATDPDDNISQWEWYVNNQSRGGQSLSPTGSITRSFSHTFSGAGNYTVTVTFTDLDGESDSVSWSVAVCCMTQGSPDLYVYSPSVYDKVFDAGESFQMSFWVRNQGDAASTTTATLRYYRSTNSTISTSDTQLTVQSGTTGVGPIEASGSTLVSVYLNAHSSGTYYYGACVGPVAGESNTRNNCAAVFRVTLAAPDLVVESESVSDGSVEAGDTFTFRAIVRNQGNGTAASTTLRYYRSTNSAISTSETEVDTDSVRSLDPSETSAESERLTAPDIAGTYYYGACVDSVSGESNTGNNCSAGVRVTVTAAGVRAPDLVADPPSFSDTNPEAGRSVRLTVIVRNQGNAGAASTTLRIQRSIYSDFRFSIEIEDFDVARLGASRSRSYTILNHNVQLC